MLPVAYSVRKPLKWGIVGPGLRWGTTPVLSELVLTEEGTSLPVGAENSRARQGYGQRTRVQVWRQGWGHWVCPQGLSGESVGTAGLWGQAGGSGCREVV